MMNKFEWASFNLFEFAKRFWDMFGNPTPLNVEVPQKDSNGTITNYHVPNRAMIKKQMWDDVGNAVGQFFKTVYVDEANGDDNNVGTESSPFKTIQKASYSAPQSGSLLGIRLLSDVTISAAHAILVYNRRIEIKSADSTTRTLTFDLNNGGYKCLYIRNSVLRLSRGLDIKTVNNNGGSPVQAIDLVENSFLIKDLGKFEIGKDTHFVSSYQSSIKINLEDQDSTVADNSFLIKIGYEARLSFYIGSGKINGDSITTSSLTSYISGIYRDADSGNPYNIISNLNFSS